MCGIFRFFRPPGPLVDLDPPSPSPDSGAVPALPLEEGRPGEPPQLPAPLPAAAAADHEGVGVERREGGEEGVGVASVAADDDQLVLAQVGRAGGVAGVGQGEGELLRNVMDSRSSRLELQRSSELPSDIEEEFFHYSFYSYMIF